MLITIFMNGQKKFLWISCNSWGIWFRATISLKLIHSCTEMSKIMRFSLYYKVEKRISICNCNEMALIH